jgi:hypothetical protein
MIVWFLGYQNGFWFRELESIVGSKDHFLIDYMALMLRTLPESASQFLH